MANQLIASRYKQALKSAGLSEYALAKQTQLTGPYLRKWREGRVINPGFITVLTLSSALGVSPLWLMGMDVPGPILPSRQDEQRAEVSIATGILEQSLPDIGDLLVMWAALPIAMQVVVANFIRITAWLEFAPPVDLSRALPDDVLLKAKQEYRARARARLIKRRKPADAEPVSDTAPHMLEGTDNGAIAMPLP